MLQMASQMDNNPSGTAPVQTADGSHGNSAPATPQVTEMDIMRQRLADAERERDEAKKASLAANRAVEAGRKFEKFEDFSSEVVTQIKSVKDDIAAIRQENEGLKEIIAGKSAITPNSSSFGVQPPAPVDADKAQTEAMRKMFGLPVKNQ